MSHNHGFVGRRDLLKIMGFGGLSLATGGTLFTPKSAQAAEPTSNSLTPDNALERLLTGNRRFVEHNPVYPDQSKERLKEVSQAQHPFVTILSCADSRVPAEIIFDQGIGDIFDVRLAGNVVTPEALGSIEYAVLLLGTPLLMILGHERCGAVTAAVQGESITTSINSFIHPIQPAVERVKRQPGDLVDNAVTANVHYQLERLKALGPLLAQREEQGKLKIVGGRYDLDTGEVRLLS